MRVFRNNDANNFEDVVVTMQEQNCATGYACTEFIYLNDPPLDIVHKFEVDPANGVSEIGNPWLTGINEAHGLGVDINGNLYIGEFDDDFETYSIK